MITKKSQQQLGLRLGLLAALFVAAVLAFGWAPQAHAQAVSYTADTFVTIGSTSYVIRSGSAATSVVNTATTLTVVIPAASTFTLSSLEGYELDNDVGVNETCSGLTSSVAVSGATTVIFTPDSANAACTSGGGTGGGGGGGGGSAPKSTTPTTPATPSTPVAPSGTPGTPGTPAPSGAIAAQVSAIAVQLKSLIAALEAQGGSVSAAIKAQVNALIVVVATPAAGKTSFSSDLDVGASGADVSSLQNLLIKQGYSIPAGATGFFGGQTRAAVMEYQKKNGITPVTGYFGPKTRAHVQANP